jgi:DNA-directed RNA polymerase specialized sigma24 family protein
MKIISTGAASRWTQDLLLFRVHKLSEREFYSRHMGLIRSMGKWWAARCPERVDQDDLNQEVQLEIWRAVADWDESRDVPINLYVRRCVKQRLSDLVKQHLAARDRDLRWVRAVVGRRDDIVPDEVTVAPNTGWEASARLQRTLERLCPQRAQVVLRCIEEGKSSNQVCQSVYPKRTFGGAEKEARLAVEEATQIALSL